MYLVKAATGEWEGPGRGVGGDWDGAGPEGVLTHNTLPPRWQCRTPPSAKCSQRCHLVPAPETRMDDPSNTMSM